MTRHALSGFVPIDTSIPESTNNVVLDLDPSLLAYARRNANKPFDPNEPMLTPAQRGLIGKTRKLGRKRY